MEKKEFVNPYNFIPFLGKCHRSEKKDGELTGVIEYSLLTKTPLYIRETNGYQKDFETGHYSYEFYSYGDNVPVVPSSSVRGMLRSVYEMLTDSCISVSGKMLRTWAGFIKGNIYTKTFPYSSFISTGVMHPS